MITLVNKKIMNMIMTKMIIDLMMIIKQITKKKIFHLIITIPMNRNMFLDKVLSYTHIKCKITIVAIAIITTILILVAVAIIEWTKNFSVNNKSSSTINPRINIKVIIIIFSNILFNVYKKFIILIDY